MASQESIPAKAVRIFDLRRECDSVSARLDLLAEQVSSEVASQLVGSFFRDTPRIMHRMRFAKRSQDWPALKQVAHRLRSAFGNIGAEQLLEIATDLEFSEDPAAVQHLILEMEGAFLQLYQNFYFAVRKWDIRTAPAADTLSD